MIVRRPRRRRLAIVLVTSVAATLGGCGLQPTMARPDCGTDELSTLLVVAQSVHGAQLVPCLQTIPAGWTFTRLDVRDRRSTIELASDRGGDHALVVTLRPTCETSAAGRIPSDEARTQRFEQVDRLSPHYEGTRYYVFDGGCVTYEFDLESERPSGLLNEATLMVGFVSRAELRAALAESTHGVIEDGP
jgi:hypothetical protein